MEELWPKWRDERRGGRHRSHRTTERKDSGSNGDVNITSALSTNPDAGSMPVSLLEEIPPSWREIFHVHLSMAITSRTALKHYLVLYFALVAGILPFVAGICVVVVVAGIHLWSALLLGAGGTVAPMVIALKRSRKRD